MWIASFSQTPRWHNFLEWIRRQDSSSLILAIVLCLLLNSILESVSRTLQLVTNCWMTYAIKRFLLYILVHVCHLLEWQFIGLWYFLCQIVDSLRQGHQAMVFVHSRKDTAKTAQKLVNPFSHLNINLDVLFALKSLCTSFD